MVSEDNFADFLSLYVCFFLLWLPSGFFFFILDFQHFCYDMFRDLGEVFTYSFFFILCSGFPGGSMVKNLPASAEATEDAGSISGSGRSTGGGNGTPLQYSCLGNPMDRGAWRATVHRVAKSQR